MRLDENYFALEIRWFLARRWKKNNKRRRSMTRFRRALRRGGIAIDCGANVGEVSELMIREGMEVFAFEPDPLAFSELQKRLGENPRAHLFNKAVGANNRTVNLRRSDKISDNSIKWTEASSIQSLSDACLDTDIPVEVIDICQFLRELPSPPAVMKIDIEGS